MLGVDELLVEGGEALTVVDKTEAWMFHILPDDTGTSAVWCAQRVPDSHITIVANAFVIRKVDPSDPDFMFSSNMWDVAERMGWWSQDDGLLDFKMTFGAIRSRPNYSNRRV
jgi:dipeptidase